MARFWKNFLREEEGQDLIEYSLILAFVALAAVALFNTIGGSIGTIWTNIDTQLAAGAQNAGQ